MTKETGGPAFPRDHASDGHNGMTLRDYFAAKAMHGMLSRAVMKGVNPVTDVEYAELAYQMADAMLAERSK